MNEEDEEKETPRWWRPERVKEEKNLQIAWIVAVALLLMYIMFEALL